MGRWNMPKPLETILSEDQQLSPHETKDNGSAILCVDLDGTLLASDVLWESALLLF